MRNNSKKLIAIILIVTVLIGLGVFLYIYFSKVDPKRYYEGVMNNISSNLKKEVEKTKQNFNGTLYIKYKDDVIKETGLNVKYSFDYERQKQQLDLSLLYDNNSIDGNVFISSNRAYLKLKNVFDNYYYLNIEDYAAYTQQSMPSDFADAVKSGLNVLKQTLKDENYDYISENGEQKVVLKISEDKYVEFVKAYISNLRNNQEFVNNVSKVTEETNTEVRENLNKMLNEEYTPRNITITTYLKNRKAYKVVVSDTKEKIVNTTTIDIINDKTYNVEFVNKLDDKENKVKVIITKDGNNTLINANYEDKSINISNNIEYGKALEDPNTSNSKDLSTLSDTEQLVLMNKIYTNENIKKFITAVTKELFSVSGGFDE